MGGGTHLSLLARQRLTLKWPDSYGEEESDTGDRLACGVIVRK